MKNVKHINFLSDKKKKRAIIYYDNGKQLEVSRKAGEYAVRQYAKDHNIEDYLELIDMKFVNVYALNSADRKARELSPDLMLRELQRRNELQPILSTEIVGIDFFEDKENDNLYSKVSYQYTFRDGNKDKKVKLEESVDVVEAIDLLISYANENKVDNIAKVFAKDGIANVQEDLEDYFEEEIIPKIQVKMKVERNKTAKAQQTKSEPVNENNTQKKAETTQEQNETQNATTTTASTVSKGKNANTNQFFGLNDNSIGKIVKYSFVDEYDEIRTCAVIFYTDGSVRNVSNTEADELFAKFAFQYGVNELGLRNRSLGFYDEVSGKTLVEEFARYRREAMEGNEVLNDYLFNNKRNTSVNPIHNNATNNSNNQNTQSASANSKNNSTNSNNNSTNSKNNSTNSNNNSTNSNNNSTNSKNNSANNKNNTKNKKNKKNNKKSNKKKETNFIKKMFANLMATKWMKKFMSWGLVQRIAIGFGALFVMVSGVTLGGKAIKNLLGDDTNQENVNNTATVNSNTVEANINENNIREDFSDCTYKQLIKKCENNNKRKDAMETMYNFINNYNHTIGYTYKEANSDIRAVHTMDEVVAMYLAYNEIDPDTIHEIFNTTELNAKDLKEKLISAQYQDSLVHNIQTRSLDKSDLFTKQADKDLYNKYEKLFIDMNESFDEDKKNFKEKFYDMVREDLPGMATYDYKNVDSSKVIIKEFMDAMDNVNVEVSNSLSNQEKNYINGIMANVVDIKLQTIATRQTARNIEMKMDYNSQIVDSEPYYDDFKNAIVNELTNENAYYTTDENRDVSFYKSFARNTMCASDVVKDENIQETTKTDTNTQTSSTNNNDSYTSTKTASTESSTTNSYTNSSTNSSANTTANTNSGNTSATNTNNNNSNTSGTTSTSDSSNNQETDKGQSEEIIVGEQEIAIEDMEFMESESEMLVDESGPERIFDDMEIEHHPYPPFNEDVPSFDVDTGIDEITPDDIPTDEKPGDSNIEDLIPDEIKDFTVVEGEKQPEDDQVDMDDNVINIDQDKVDKNGNLNDQYTNVSTDQNVKESQMSNEEIVDEIIRSMEQEASEYINENDLGDFGKTL